MLQSQAKMQRHGVNTLHTLQTPGMTESNQADRKVNIPITANSIALLGCIHAMYINTKGKLKLICYTFFLLCMSLPFKDVKVIALLKPKVTTQGIQAHVTALHIIQTPKLFHPGSYHPSDCSQST